MNRPISLFFVTWKYRSKTQTRMTNANKNRSHTASVESHWNVVFSSSFQPVHFDAILIVVVILCDTFDVLISKHDAFFFRYWLIYCKTLSKLDTRISTDISRLFVVQYKKYIVRCIIGGCWLAFGVGKQTIHSRSFKQWPFFLNGKRALNKY